VRKDFIALPQFFEAAVFKFENGIATSAFVERDEFLLPFGAVFPPLDVESIVERMGDP